MWLNKEVNLGEVKEGTKHKVVFKNDKQLKIDNIVVPCSCLKYDYQQTKGELNVTFKADAVPRHLKYKGEFIAKKTVKVYSKENGKEELIIRAVIQMPHIFKKSK